MISSCVFFQLRAPLVYGENIRKLEEYCWHRKKTYPGVSNMGMTTGNLHAKNSVPTVLEEFHSI
jgi:hypothetical protein